MVKNYIGDIRVNDRKLARDIAEGLDRVSCDYDVEIHDAVEGDPTVVLRVFKLGNLPIEC